MSQYSWDPQTMRLLVIRRCTDVHGTKKKPKKSTERELKDVEITVLFSYNLLCFHLFYFIICEFYEFETTMSIPLFKQYLRMSQYTRDPQTARLLVIRRYTDVHGTHTHTQKKKKH